jgi:hypothetical protein
MKIHEYQGKTILARHGVPVPRGEVAFSAAEAGEIARRLGGSVVVVKAQIHAGGRGKGGGVKLANSVGKVSDLADQMIGSTLVTAQTGETEDFLRAGRALGAAIAATSCSVLLIASGAMSHTFWSLRELRAHEASDPAHIRTAAARGADAERIAWLQAGDHTRVIETMPAFLKYRPEARFGPYLMMIAALGEGAVAAPGRAYSEYENSVGTGQMHIWFDRPAGGWR